MGLFRSLFGEKDKSAVNPPEPVLEQDPESTTQAWLLELFKGHDLPASVHNEWVVPNGELPGIRGSWWPGETHGRLDVDVLVRDDVLIEERFGGFGAGDAGLADGFKNFTINSFHVLLSALWSQHDPEQVEIESWSVMGRQFRAFIGNVGTRSSSDVKFSLPMALMPKLAAVIQCAPLDQDLHWFRFYAANINGEFTFEALKDNEPWPAGLTTLASCGWEPSSSFYSARLFMVLRAAPNGEAAV